MDGKIYLLVKKLGHSDMKMEYAKNRINNIKDEMGEITSVFVSDKKLFVEFQNGMNLQLHDDEIYYQAISFLESQIEES